MEYYEFIISILFKNKKEPLPPSGSFFIMNNS